MARRLSAAAAALAACLFASGAAALSPDLSDSVSNALVRDAELTLHFRSYYLDRRRPAPAAESEAWAAGGWLGYRSGWFADVFGIGLTAYTSQRVWGPPENDGTLLLKPGQESYSVLGQAYASLKLRDQVFTGYRQLVDAPEVNPQDNRMTPNTFQGYTLSGKLGIVSYLVGYLDKMKTRNADEFRDFATVAGAVGNTHEGMWLGIVAFKPHERIVLRLSSYRVENILSSTYSDVEWATPLAESLELRLGGQFMHQSSTGANLLTGTSFSVNAGGIKADLKRGPGTFTVAYTQIGKGQDYRSPYGTWAGYTSMIVEDFSRAGERALLIGGAYDFAAHGVPGLSVFVNAVFGDKAIDAATRVSVSDKTEYDATLDYRFTGARRAWLKPLWIRLRAVRVEENSPTFNGVTKDYRAIVNYQRVFK